MGEQCLAVNTDITRADDRKRLIKAAAAHGDGIDALVNNAGNMLHGAVTDLDGQALMRLFQTTVIAAMMLTGMAVSYLEKRKGAVIFIGSAHTRRAFAGASAYACKQGSSSSLRQGICC